MPPTARLIAPTLALLLLGAGWIVLGGADTSMVLQPVGGSGDLSAATPFACPAAIVTHGCALQAGDTVRAADGLASPVASAATAQAGCVAARMDAAAAVREVLAFGRGPRSTRCAML
jgi:hypothetical protein